ncbi:MAG TPA: helix-turn-helix transcriptional regulator [Geothrix sp.]|jgi:transcriptional regulator with XRE-family HTH domain
MIAAKNGRRKTRAAFPENLKQIREQMGLGQRAFADYLDVTQQTVSLWERGTRQPGKRTWTLLEQKLHITRGEMESGPLSATLDPKVAESKAFAKSVTLPPPRRGNPITGIELNGLAAESMDLAKAQRLLREAVRQGKPVWLIRG